MAVELYGVSKSFLFLNGAGKRGGILCSSSFPTTPLFKPQSRRSRGRKEAPLLLLQATPASTNMTTSRPSSSSSFCPPTPLCETYKEAEEELALASPCPCSCPCEEEEGKQQQGEGVTHEKLDQWIRDSIEEIVRNIGEAPFLLQIFSLRGQAGTGAKGSPSSSLQSSSSSIRVERQAGHSWSDVRRRWGGGTHRRPDGVVLIQELRREEAEVEVESEDGDGNRTWGLVVQGRGLDYAACYVLDTCRVRSSLGMCTHFCLVRAQCFGESVDTQLNKAWLSR